MSSYSNTVQRLNLIQLLQSFTFYGVRSLLVLYFTQKLFFSDAKALTIYGNTMSFLYLSPLIGGLLIDNYWSSIISLKIGVIITCIGTLLISLPYDQTFVYGLAILIIGQALFKPTVPYLMDQIYSTAEHKRSSGYTLYYVMINIGSALSPIFCGILKQTYNWQASFIACLISSCIALFFSLKYTDKHINSSSVLKENWLKILGFTVVAGISSLFIYSLLNSPQWMDQFVLYLTLIVGVYLGYLYFCSENKQNTLLMLLAIFLFCLFAALFEQAGGSITLFIEKHVDRSVGGFTNLPSSLFLGLNPFFTIIIGFIFIRLFKFSANFLPLRQLSFGFLCITLGFGLLWVSSGLVTELSRPSILWIIGAFLFHSLGELCIVPVTLSLATGFASQQNKGKVIGLWYLAAAYGHYLAIWISKSILEQNSSISNASVASATNFSQVFYVTAGIAFICALVLMIISFIINNKGLAKWNGIK